MRRFEPQCVHKKKIIISKKKMIAADNLADSSSSHLSCLDICNDDGLRVSRSSSECYSAVDDALAVNEPRENKTEDSTSDALPRAFYDTGRRSWLIRIQNQDVVEVVPKETRDSELYRLYWEANNQLIALGMKLEGTQAELQQVLRVNEKLRLENMMMSERVNRIAMENKLQSYEHKRENDEHQREYEDLKAKYQEYRSTTKTLVNHMQNQKKKSKKESN